MSMNKPSMWNEGSKEVVSEDGRVLYEYTELTPDGQAALAEILTMKWNQYESVGGEKRVEVEAMYRSYFTGI